MSSVALLARVCGARFLADRANCMARFLLLTPELRVKNDPIPGCDASDFLFAAQLAMALNFAEIGPGRGIVIFLIFLLPRVLTALVPSLLLGEKYFFGGPFLSTSCQFPTSIRLRKTWQNRAPAVNLLENSGPNSPGCKKESSIFRCWGTVPGFVSTKLDCPFGSEPVASESSPAVLRGAAADAEGCWGIGGRRWADLLPSSPIPIVRDRG